MPPSPVLRYSPGREPRGANHKRGQSFEGGLLFSEKDDNLALFNEMQTRERENSLLLLTDDIEDTFSTKLRHFSDYKLGISIPVRGESSDLLNADEEKNDYDWLLTPPDTPLFPSLDDEPLPVNAAPRGRPRSQPISISRSSTMEKSYRSSRGSSSPNRLSPSPRSGSSTFQSRERPSSATHSSPPLGLRHASPSRRPSTPPSKPSTPTPRSSTPTPRRMSTGSSGTIASPGTRGTSPIKTNRGNSVSPKIRAWQANIPGFSSDAPPNLRTSLADRPASYVRGSSPASRNGRDSTSKVSRQSMSPTASRSITSSHSHDRDRFSYHSKGSVASSGDDDIDSLQSIPVGSLDRATSRRVGPLSNNGALPFSKKSTRIVSSASAPKRSFDPALRQMDNRKSPQNMFRPLLSSVPSTTFYVGKASSAHRSLISRNSVTTSSKASSDRGISAAVDNEGGDQNQDDMASECGKVAYPDVHEEVFAFDKMDEVNEDSGHEMHDVSLRIQHGEFVKSPAANCGYIVSENFGHHGIAVEISATSEASQVKADSPGVDILENMASCSRCGSAYGVVDEVEWGIKLCPECRRKDDILSVIISDPRSVVAVNSPVMSIISEEEKPSDEMEPVIVVPEFVPITCVDERRVSVGEETAEQGQIPQSEQQQNFSPEYARSLVEEAELKDVNRQEVGQPTVGYSITDDDTVGQQLHRYNDYPNLKVDFSEGTGISILLKRPSSSKGPVFQGRTFAATTILYDDRSHARDSASSMRSSIGQGSFSASSSTDFSLARQLETRIQRHLSGRKADMEHGRSDVNMKSQSTGSPLSGISNHGHRGLENLMVSDGNVEHAVVEKPRASEEQALVSEYALADATSTYFTRTAVVETDNSECNDRSTVDVSNLGLSRHIDSVLLENNSVASFPNYEKNYTAYGSGEYIPENTRSVMDVEATIKTPESSSGGELAMMSSSTDEVGDAQVPSQSSVVTLSKAENEKCCQGNPGSQIDEVCLISMSTMGELQESSVSDPNTSDHAYGILEESAVMVDCQGGSKSRSVTLEEATDAILFCSSIVHDLAYQAANLAIEKENSIPLEGSWPTVTILGKSNSDRKIARGRTAGKPRAWKAKAHKTRQRQVETDAKPASNKTENDENANDSLNCNVGVPDKVDSMKPPKLESKCNCTIM